MIAQRVRGPVLIRSQLPFIGKTSVGPFAHIRPDSIIGPRSAVIGNFTGGQGLSKIGFGSKVNRSVLHRRRRDRRGREHDGAGTITCNYDGKEKHKTTIGAKAFIGSNVNLIAPVKVGRGAKVAAGSTVTEDVPDDALAIARARQVNKT